MPHLRLKIGAGKADITPEGPTDLIGHLTRENPSLGVHDRLFARAIVFSQGANTIVLVACDLIGLDREFVRKMRNDVGREMGIPPASIMISCTHTHTGPAVMHLMGFEIQPKEILLVKQGILASVRKAFENLDEAKIYTGYEEAAIGVSRPDYRHGSVDKKIGVIFVKRKEDNAPIATIVNYACHPVVLAEEARYVSADYPGRVTALIEKRIGGECLFLNGACGDINPRYRGLFDTLELVSSTLAEKVYEAERDAKPVKKPTLGSASFEIEISYKIPTLRTLRKKIALLQSREKEGDPLTKKIEQVVLKWAQDKYQVLSVRGSGRKGRMELQVFQIGDIALVGIPGEVFVDIGLNLKKMFQPKSAFIIGYANGNIGYIPTDKAIKKGDYETKEACIYYNSFPFALGVEKAIRDGVRAAKYLLKED